MKTLVHSVLITGVSLGMFLTADAQENAKNTAKIAQADSAEEPNVEIASTWWPDLENTWVPIGWKDHPLRFNVLYNGTLISQSPPSLAMGGIVRHPDRGQGVQLTFQLSRDGAVPIGSSTSSFQLRAQDGGVGDQGWCDQAAPVLWTRWRQGNLVLRQEVFAYMPGGGPVTTGLEPLFAWVRLSLEPSSSGDAFALVRINQPHIQTTMDRNENLLAVPAVSAYPRPLRLESAASRTSHLLLDDTEQVRLAITSSEQAAVAFIDQRPASADTYLKIAIPAGTDEDVDLLVPLVPADRSTVEAELAIGRDAALCEANRHWAVTIPTASHVDSPEPLVNEAARQAVRFCEVITEWHPESGQYSLLTGSWHYEALWATPTSMNITMILDGLGHHEAAAKYLDIFRQEQGTIVPPGAAYLQHPGYLATPRRLTSIDWLTDHGAILHAAAHHALVTDDPQFIELWTEPIVKACEFIRDFRTSVGHGGVEGILPAAVPNDNKVQDQTVWTDGWNYKGLSTAVRLLQRIRHPRAEEFACEATAYRESFRREIQAAMPQMPEWTDGDGHTHRYVPTALPKGGNIHHPFYLDSGPLFLVYSGLMTADDDLMRSALHYFRTGPNTQSYDLAGAWHQKASLRHELSSCEPCYSWNVFHSWQSGDRPMFLEGMYSLLTGGLSRRTLIGCEHRGGVSGTSFPAPLTIEMVRLSVIDDQLEPSRLHLLRLVPLVWLTDGRPTKFERIPTEFGPVTLQFQLEDNGTRLRVMFEPQFRHAPQGVFLHVPPLAGLSEIVIGSRSQPAKPGDVITLQ